MSLEEKGPAQPAAASPAATPVKTTPSKQRRQHQQDTSRVPAAAADTAQGADQARQSQQQQALLQGGAGLDATGAAIGAQGFRQMPEYLVAWELEVWRKVRRTLPWCCPSFQGHLLFSFLPGYFCCVLPERSLCMRRSQGNCSPLTWCDLVAAAQSCA
jgi:hypothetical protein